MSTSDENSDPTRTYLPLARDTKIGHYRIVEKIGAGGMGEVYLAEDTKLGRKVALKFLPSYLCRDEECLARFKREAQAVAKLDHPNIVPVHEVAEHQGRPYFVMAAIEGQSLKELVSAKELPVERILELGIQICEGLQAAHDKGIIHRDIKPSNILIDARGRVRIVDFGLASIGGSEQLTKTGSTLGTIGYMSPEQVLGQETDHRSDLFSLGVVLYELITKQNPFKRDSEAATLKSVSEDTPHPLARYRAGVPDGLQNIVDKALEKDVNIRYQHADGMLSDLMRVKRALESGHSTTLATSHSQRLSRRWWAAALIVVAAASVLIVTKPWRADSTSDKPDRIMLAVLPFENLGSPEDEYFADGITDEITSRLAGLSALRVISRTSAIQYKDTDKGLPQIAAELGVDYILEGTIRWDKTGDTCRVRITPQLIRVSDNTHLWTDRYNVVIENIFSVQSSIAERVAEELDITLLESEQLALAERLSDNPEAYDYYLRGLKYFGNHNPKDYMNAEEMFLTAIELDSTFASAYAWLSVVCTQIYSWYLDRTDERLSAAKAAADSALCLAPNLPIAHGAMAWYHYAGVKNRSRALEEFTSLREKQPSDATFSFCIALIERSQGKWEEAVADFQRALKLNPRSATYCSEYGIALIYLRRYDEAESLCNRAIEFKPDFRQPHHNKSLIYLYRNGDIQGAGQVLREALQKNDRWSNLTDLEVVLCIMEGDYDRALTLLNNIRDMSEIPSYDSAFCYNLKGMVHGYLHQEDLMESCYDSARVILERLIRSDSTDFWYHAELGLTYAGLGRKQAAIREGQLSVELLTASENAMQEVTLLSNLASIYSLVGEYDRAIEQLDYLLSVPSEVSVPLLEIWPDFAPMRELPRFQALLKKYEAKSE